MAKRKKPDPKKHSDIVVPDEDIIAEKGAFNKNLSNLVKKVKKSK